MTALAPTSTQTAVANGGTRTLSFYHAHRKDRLTVTFRRNGRYVASALKQLNYYLRDWRNDEQIRMDPRLFDVIWETYRMVGARQPVTVLSSYRSSKTNSMLRRRSRRVAKNSQHMYGKAMDVRFPGVNMHRVREAAFKLQRGGVGWYRSGFVHLDVGSVRAWPRMSYSQLARLFPDGKTVHVSRSGRTLPGYEEARAMISARNGTYVPTLAQVREKGFLERLFGWGDSGDVADQRQSRRDRRRLAARLRNAPKGATGPVAAENESAASFFRKDIRRAKGDAPTRVAAVNASNKTPQSKPAKAAVSSPADKPEANARAAAVAPIPPRRPSELQIAKLIDNATPDVPLPPEKPENLIVVAENSKIPDDSRGRLAALIGSNGPGAIADKKNLPSVITQGTAVAGTVTGTPDALAFAGPIHPSYVRQDDNRRGAKVVRVALRRKAPAATALAKAIGARAASRVAARSNSASELCAARLTASDLSRYAVPEQIAKVNMGSLIGPRILPLRVAARFGPKRMMFAQPERVRMIFSRHSLRVQTHQRFIPLKRQRAEAPKR